MVHRETVPDANDRTELSRFLLAYDVLLVSGDA